MTTTTTTSPTRFEPDPLTKDEDNAPDCDQTVEDGAIRLTGGRDGTEVDTENTKEDTDIIYFREMLRSTTTALGVECVMTSGIV